MNGPVSRRRIVRAAAALGPAIVTSKTMALERPNILFVTADQLRARSLGYLGSSEVRTPHLDRLASEGVNFTQAVANCPICTPARAIWQTGRYPTSTGVVSNDIRLPAGEITGAKVLRDAGYKTGYIGKWHLDGPDRKGFTPPGPRRQGFDYWAAANICHEYFKAFYYTGESAQPVSVAGYQPDHETDLAIRFLEDHRKDKFYLNLHWGPPHDPYIAPPRWMEMYDAGSIQLPENVVQGVPEELHPAARRQLAAYYAAISCVDWNMGRLLKALEDLGLAERTAVVFTSDHGDMLLSLGLLSKQWPYEESVRVPLLVRYPARVRPGGRRDCLISHVDLMPTLVSLAGARIPPGVQGSDLSALILGEGVTGPEAALIMIVQPCARYNDRAGMQAWRGLRTRSHTYARFRHDDWCLYDNERDPYQRRNLLAAEPVAPAAQALRERMNAELQSRLKRIGDGFDTPAFPKIRWQ